MVVAAVVSAGLHVALLGGVLLWMHRSHSIVLVPVETPATVQLVMSPPGGEPSPAAAAPPTKPAEQPPAPKPPQEAAAVPQAPPAAPATATEPAPVAAPPSPPAPPATAATAPPPPAPPTPAATAPAPSAAPAEAAVTPPPPARPAPKPTDDKLTFDFAQAESDTNAWVTGNSVVPPSPDIKSRNRKPAYPTAAAQRGEQGTVILLIHVTAEGTVTDVEIAQSSGFPLLDRAAADAAQTWHFLPSIKDGEPAPADLPFKFVFALD